MLFEFSKNAVSGYAGALGELVERVCSNCCFEVLRRDGMIGPAPHPRLRCFAPAGLLKFFEQLAKSAAEDRSSPAATHDRAMARSAREVHPAVCHR